MMNKKLPLAALMAAVLTLTACGGESASSNQAAPAASAAAPVSAAPAATSPEQAKAEIGKLVAWYQSSTQKRAEAQAMMAQKTQEIQQANPNEADMKAKMAEFIKEHSAQQIAQSQDLLKEVQAIAVSSPEAQELKALLEKELNNQVDMMNLSLKAIESPTPELKAEIESKAQEAMADAQKLVALLQKHAQ